MKSFKLQFIAFLSSIIFYLCLLPNTALASVPDLDTLLDSMHTLSADFTQTVTDNQGKVLQQAAGHMALARPGKFRWEMATPIPQIIIANGSRLWIYDPDLEQVTIRSLKHVAGETPALLLSHENIALEKEFNVQALKKSNASWQWFRLVPRAEETSFAAIEFGFYQQQIQEMRLEDRLGHATRIQFKNVVLNKNLPATLFTFKPPANVDVIDESRHN